MTGPISIIGAAGFVGTRLVESLVLDGHRDVRAVVRAYRSVAALARFGPAVDVRLADAEDAEALASAVRGSAVVVNLTTGAPAGIVRSTRSILQACAAAGVGRLVHLSSAVVYRDVPFPYPDDEAPPVTGHWMPYARAKATAELWLREQMPTAACEVTVLRPGIVWGVRSPHTMDTVRALLEKRAYLVGRGEGVFNAVYIDNLTACVRACCDDTGDASGFYNVGDDEFLTWRDFYSALAEPLGYDMARMPLVSGERFPWSAGAALDYARSLPVLNGLYPRLKARTPDAVKSRTKKRISGRYEYRVQAADYLSEPAVDRELWHLQRTRHQLPTHKFASRFGFTPAVTFRDGIQRTLLWLSLQGCVPTQTATLAR